MAATGPRGSDGKTRLPATRTEEGEEETHTRAFDPRTEEQQKEVSRAERKRAKNRKATKRFREKEKASKDFIKMMLREMTDKLDGVPDLSMLTPEELKQHWVWMANTTRTLAYAVEHNKFDVSPVTGGPEIDLEVGLMDFVPDLPSLPALPTLPTSFPLFPLPARPTVPQSNPSE